MDFSSIFITVAIFVSPYVDAYVVHYRRCPTTFELHGKECFKVISVQATWAEAKRYCQVIGGDLAQITAAKVQKIIDGLVHKKHGIVSNERYWVDGSDMLQIRKWRWMRTNGASVPFFYTNWSPGEPNNKYENCVEVRWDRNGMWNDLDCSTRISFICQAKPHKMDFNDEMDR